MNRVGAGAVTGVTALRLALVGWLSVVASTNPPAAAQIFAVAWTLDAVDGWLARRWHATTYFGFLFDKLVDRLLIVVGVFAVIHIAVVPPFAIFIITKELVALPALVIELVTRQHISNMGYAGKVLAVAQGLTVLWLLFNLPGAVLLIAAVALGGAGVGLWHLYSVVSRPSLQIGQAN